MDVSIKSLSLDTLPTEVQDIIVRLLSRQAAASPLVPARYGLDLQSSLKYLEYYGPLLEEDPANTAITALLNLSSTCSYFRRKLSHLAFRSIVVHNSTKNLKSIASLIESDLWHHVKSLTFCPKATDYDIRTTSFRNMDPLEWKRHSLSVSKLEEILKKLPPALETLTLDFFHAPAVALAPDPVGDTSNNWRETIQTCIDTTDRPLSQLNIFNLSTWLPELDAQQVQQLLRRTGSLNIGLHWSDEARLRYDHCAFIDHVDNVRNYIVSDARDVTSFAFHADDLGPVAYEMDHSAFSPLVSPHRMENLRHLSLERVFFDDALVEFMVSHSSTLVSLTLVNCYATCNDPTLWETLFDSIANAKSEALQEVVVDHIDLYAEISDRAKGRGSSAFIVSDHEWALRLQEIAAITEMLDREQEMAQDPRRARKLLPFGGVTIVDEFLVYDENTMIQEFNRGGYHMAWNRVMDLLDENNRRGTLKVPHGQQSQTMRYPTDSRGKLRAYDKTDVKRLLER